MSSSPRSLLAHLSRGIREGPAARFIPWRFGAPLERWTIAHGYPAVTMRPFRLNDAPPEATLIFGGDLALHRYRPEAGDHRLVDGLARLRELGDASIVNLESQLTGRITPAGSIGTLLRADPAVLPVLSRLGISAVTCANNHCLDFGATGLAESVARLEEAGITVSGVSDSRRDGAAVLPVRGVRVGLLAFADDWRVEGEEPGGALPAGHNPGAVREAIGRMRARADVVAVQLHWGYEWSMYPMRSLRDLARSYVEAGAHLVVCHHAHVPMGVEAWRGGVIAHGLGNLYFGTRSRNPHPFRHASFVLRVGLVRGGIAGAEILPVRTDASGFASLDSGAGAGQTLRCLAYLSGRLDRDRYLDRVEASRLSQHGAQLLVDLVRRVGAGDAAGARERIRNLATPRHRALTGGLRVRGGLMGEVGVVLEQLAQGGPDAIAGGVRAELRALAVAVERFLSRLRPVGRIP